MGARGLPKWFDFLRRRGPAPLLPQSPPHLKKKNSSTDLDPDFGAGNRGAVEFERFGRVVGRLVSDPRALLPSNLRLDFHLELDT